MKSSLFSFLLKKLPLEALGITASLLLTSEQFYQNGRLGPPDSEGLLRIGQLFSRKAEIPLEKQ